MRTIGILMVLVLVAYCLAAGEDGNKKTGTGKMGEPKPPSDLPKAPGAKNDGKDKDLKSAETFGFGYYGGLYPYGYYSPYSYPYHYGYPFVKYYKYGYPGYPYFGYKSYPFYDHHHHWPYWG